MAYESEMTTGWEHMVAAQVKAARERQADVQGTWDGGIRVREAPQRVQFGERQDYLMKELAVLGEALDALAARLELVLGPERAEMLEKAPPPLPEEETSPLVVFLHSTALHVMRLRRQVEALTERVDL